MYYPKSKIQENKYTSGNQFKVSLTGKPYEGLYHMTFDGNFYTGATHTSDSQLLVKITSQSNSISGSSLVTPSIISNFEYDSITSNKFSFLKKEIIPTSFYPIPTDKDYSSGFIQRYFMKRTGGTSSDIKEISGDGYSNITNNLLYLSISFQWKITGPMHDQVIDFQNTIYGVIDTNARTVANNEINLPGITAYLINLSEFAKFI